MNKFKIFLVLAFCAFSTAKADIETTVNDAQKAIAPPETAITELQSVNAAEITKNNSTKINTPLAAPEVKTDKERFTGFFLGINAGALINWSKAHIRASGEWLDWAQDELNARKYSMKFKNAGFTGGVQAGYQYQHKNFYCGLETDFDYSSLKKKITVDRVATLPVLGNIIYQVTHKINWYGTLRPKIGAAFDPVVIYATGGLAYGHIKSSTYLFYYGVDDDAYLGSTSKTKIGWTIGGGLGYMIADHWSLNTDYLFVDLRKDSYVSPSDTFPTYTHTTTLKNRFHDVRLGLNYIF